MTIGDHNVKGNPQFAPVAGNSYNLHCLA